MWPYLEWGKGGRGRGGEGDGHSGSGNEPPAKDVVDGDLVVNRPLKEISSSLKE